MSKVSNFHRALREVKKRERQGTKKWEENVACQPNMEELAGRLKILP